MTPSEQSTAYGMLYTDQYQLTMAQLYFRAGLHEREAQFDHFFRSTPDYGSHQAGYCINAGLEWLLDWMANAHFRDEDLDFLRGQTSSVGEPLFAEDFLAWLRCCGTLDGITLRAIPEGRVVHPNVPLTVVQGPLAMAQILETPLLNHLNYQTLIATKAARMHQSGRGQLLLEFGLRRAQERAANAGARAALIGGADFTSNVGISHVLGLPPKGTHAHSMVQLFMALGGSELDAFQAYAELYPDDCLLLVDTVDTLHSGVPNAIRVFEELQRKGHRPVGVRLDSGDLAYLSIETAKQLNAAGFDEASIVLSNQLDELVMMQIIAQIQIEAPRNGLDPEALIRRLVFGVGTRLITSGGDGALDGVYKLVAVQGEGSATTVGANGWLPAIKLSETPAKVPNPGDKLVWRVYDVYGRAVADLLSLSDEQPADQDPLIFRHPTDHTAHRALPQAQISKIEPLLVDIVREGQRVGAAPGLEELRARREADIERLYPGVCRLVNPHRYHVSLTQKLWDLKQALIAAAH